MSLSFSHLSHFVVKELREKLIAFKIEDFKFKLAIGVISKHRTFSLYRGGLGKSAHVESSSRIEKETVPR